MERLCQTTLLAISEINRPLEVTMAGLADMIKHLVQL